MRGRPDSGRREARTAKHITDKTKKTVDPGAYLSKEEKKIPSTTRRGNGATSRFCPSGARSITMSIRHASTGKWVMLKALKKEYADNPEHRATLEKEFDTRYNLAHPNIVMVNDLEIVPGAGSGDNHRRRLRLFPLRRPDRREASDAQDHPPAADAAPSTRWPTSRRTTWCTIPSRPTP